MKATYQNKLDTLQSQLSIAITQIQQMEERFQCAKDITHMGMWVWDIPSQTLDISKEIYEILGLDPNQVTITMPYIAETLIHRDHREKYFEALLDAQTQGKVGSTTYLVNHPTKDPCWVKIHSKLTAIKEDMPSQITGVLIDVTSEMITQQKLADEKNFVEMLIENIPNPVYYKGTDLIYRYCNQSFCNFIGYSKDQIIGRNSFDVAPQELAQIYYKADMNLLRTEVPQTYEANVAHSDGKDHLVLFSKGVQRASDGKVVGLVGLMQDITESRRIEHELKMLHAVKDIFLNINHNLLSYVDKKDFFTAVQWEIQNIFTNCQQSTVLEVGQDGNLRILVNNGYEEEASQNFQIKLEDSFLHKESGLNDQVCIINNIIEDFENDGSTVIPTINRQKVQSSLSIPLFVDGNLKWIICLDSNDNNSYTDADRVIAEYIREELPIIFRVFDLYQETLYLSKYDPLTGLYNFQTFDHICETLIDKAHPERDQVVYTQINLKDLKRINDTYGRAIANECLLTLGQYLKDLVTPDITVARIGGNEFAAIFLGQDTASVNHRLSYLQASFNQTELMTKTGPLHPKLVYEVVTYGLDGNKKSDLLSAVNHKLYLKRKKSV